MNGPPVAVALVRTAVRRACADIPADATILVACSGGADSLALAAAAAFEGRRKWRVGLVTVDHGLQDGSAGRAAGIALWARESGFQPVDVRTVEVGRTGGPEAAARAARYDALDKSAAEHGATAVLLGHTRDDQAETVLLGLARGSGARSLAGMPARRGIYRRPLLSLPRTLVREAASAAGREPWEDPHNTDPAYARSRVRRALRELTEALGPGLDANLARTADLLRADADALDDLVAAIQLGPEPAVDQLLELPTAIRTRAIKRWLRDIPATAVHIEAVDALLIDWHGQGPVALPLGQSVIRRHGRLHLVRADEPTA
jgi:tRNA(Ile)-lysidine synthase